ncbi:MAG: methionine biosynthesis protein MetW [Victivallales bacterium]|nr:methionine biosynthesis protein MetW [Victivallales bacterium]
MSVIASIIPHRVSLLDLGCGDGSLLRLLATEKAVHGQGVEISSAKIMECIAAGVPVIHGDLNHDLIFRDRTFDYAVLSQTLQAVERPDLLLREMLRVSEKAIVSFINFGYFKARLQLLWRGRMPVTHNLPDTWYNTRNIHLATVQDFRDLCRVLNIKIMHEIPLGNRGDFWARRNPNLLASTCVFVLTRA